MVEVAVVMVLLQALAEVVVVDQEIILAVLVHLVKAITVVSQSLLLQVDLALMVAVGVVLVVQVAMLDHLKASAALAVLE